MKYPLFVIQSWKVEKWVTFYVTSYGPDAEEVFEELVAVAGQLAEPKKFRLLRFDVPSYDFLSTYAHDVQVLTLAETAGQDGV